MEIFKDLLIFEMANSHQGSIEHGLKIISEMKNIMYKHNVKTAVKFQFRDLDTFIHNDFKGNKDVKHISRFESTRLSKVQFGVMVAKVKELGMVAVSTPFDENGVDWCLDLGIDILKIASCSADDWPLLEKAAQSKLPIIISTGGKSIQEIDKIYNFLLHRNVNFAMLHCVSEYPVKPEDVQLDFIDKMKKRYPDVVIGYSGHENPDDEIIPQMAIAKGAQILERHVGLPTDKITLNAYSMNPIQADKWVQSIVNGRKICKINGMNDRNINLTEKASLQSLMRGVYLKKDLKKGTEIKIDDIYFAMPLQDGQTSTSVFKEGMIASVDYYKDEPLKEVRISNDIMMTREIIHEAKSLINEAGIKLGDEFTVELSHHYGIKNFRKIGATIVNIINREYCKKLIIVLPGQEHPEHYHKIKEETFQLLNGDLTCVLDKIETKLKPGDLTVVLRNQIHSFSSINGAIFEEISTTHIKGDSYYLDPNISKLDLIQRKTVIEEW